MAKQHIRHVKLERIEKFKQRKQVQNSSLVYPSSHILEKARWQKEGSKGG